jgi:ribosome maturation factor RimP
MNRTQCDLIIDFVNGEMSPLGYRCIEAEWDSSEKVLRLFIEDANHELDMEGCVKATKILNENAKLDDLVPGPYTLEVSSPGVERPLRMLPDFQRYLGKCIEVKLLRAIESRKHGKGRIVDICSESPQDMQGGKRAAYVADGPIITIETSRGLWKFPLNALSRAHLVYDWVKSVR